MPKNKPPLSTWENRCTQFFKQEAAKRVTAPLKTDPPKPATTENIYAQARNLILARCPEWRRKEILDMEARSDTDNRHYMDFVREIIQLAEKNS